MKNLVSLTTTCTAQTVSKVCGVFFSAAKPIAIGVLLATLLSPVVAHADLITFEYIGSGASGSLDGVDFTDIDFVFQASGDTDRSVGAGSGNAIPHTSATVDLGDLGTFDFTSPTRTVVNSGTLAFGRGDGFLATLFNFTDVAFDEYDLQSSIGPISGTGTLQQWSSSFTTPAINTTGGVLIFNNQDVPETFTATVAVPEPSSVIALLGLSGLALVIRRRK